MTLFETLNVIHWKFAFHTVSAIWLYFYTGVKWVQSENLRLCSIHVAEFNFENKFELKWNWVWKYWPGFCNEIVSIYDTSSLADISCYNYCVKQYLWMTCLCSCVHLYNNRIVCISKDGPVIAANLLTNNMGIKVLNLADLINRSVTLQSSQRVRNWLNNSFGSKVDAPTGVDEPYFHIQRKQRHRQIPNPCIYLITD